MVPLGGEWEVEGVRVCVCESLEGLGAGSDIHMTFNQTGLSVLVT